MPDCWRLGCPCRTENSLIITVQQAEFRREGVGAEDGSALVPCDEHIMTAVDPTSTARRVACNEDQPLSRAGGGWVWIQEGVVVLSRKSMNIGSGNLAGGFFDGVGESWMGVVRFRDACQARHLWHFLLDGIEPSFGFLLQGFLDWCGRECERGEESGEESDCELHDCGDGV